MESQIDLKIHPLEGFHLLEGCFGVTLSLQRISDFYGYAIDEETVLGLGGGLGFVYWNRKGGMPNVERIWKATGFFSPAFLFTLARASANIPPLANLKRTIQC